MPNQTNGIAPMATSDDDGLMQRRDMSADDIHIEESERRL
jgi:nuclear transport factor 2 (NTF2) superfamily protein